MQLHCTVIIPLASLEHVADFTEAIAVADT